MIGNISIQVRNTFPVGYLRNLGTASAFRFIAIMAIAVSGAIHLSIAPAQASHALAHGMFFSGLGAAQLVWAIAFWRRPSMPLLAWTGIALSAGVIILWMLTQVASPFEFERHEIDRTLMTTKVCEFVAFIGLLLYLGSILEFKSVKAFGGKILVTSLLLGIVSGFGAWGVAHVGEAMFPELGHVEKHQSPQHESVMTTDPDMMTNPVHDDESGHDDQSSPS